MCNARSEDRISAEEFRTRLKFKSMRECLHDRRLQWFSHLERMEESVWSSKCRTFKVRGSFPKGRPRKTWNTVFRSDLKESKVNKDIAKERTAWKSLKRSRPIHASLENRRYNEYDDDDYDDVEMFRTSQDVKVLS